MFNWLRKLFAGDQETKTLETYTPPKVEAPAPKPAKTSTKKSTANTGRKKGPKKAGVTKTDLNKMTKDQLEKFAKKEFKVDIDKRRKKADLVEEVLKLIKKNA